MGDDGCGSGYGSDVIAGAKAKNDDKDDKDRVDNKGIAVPFLSDLFGN